MYLSGTLTIDPSQITMIKKVKPTRMFAKVLSAITFGASSERQEQETFTAISILQQLNMALRSLKIKNVIRLAIDDYDFYMDEQGQDDDLKEAMFVMESKIDPIEAEYFNTIYFVVEHNTESIKFVVEISIKRKHKVGEYPIIVKINGVLNDFVLQEGETRESLQNKMNSLFESQETYNSFVVSKKSEFNAFVDELELAIRKFIKVDDIYKDVSTKIIRPKEKVETSKTMQYERTSDPIFYGYYGMDSFIFYTFLWSSMCYSHNTYVNDFILVDEIGNNVMSVGDLGFNSGDFNTMNDEAPFEPPTEGDLSFYAENSYADELTSANVSMYDDANGDSPDNIDTFDTFGEESSSCNSCSSCGSCSSKD